MNGRRAFPGADGRTPDVLLQIPASFPAIGAVE